MIIDKWHVFEKNVLHNKTDDEKRIYRYIFFSGAFAMHVQFIEFVELHKKAEDLKAAWDLVDLELCDYLGKEGLNNASSNDIRPPA